MFDLTKEEKTVLLFLLGCLIVGTGVNFYEKRGGVIADNAILQPVSRAVAEEDPPSVNINTADFYRLLKIKGIGRCLASRIIEFRNKNGPFFIKEDIMKVKGIGRGRFGGIKDYITTE